jgi:hypothetical protein
VLGAVMVLVGLALAVMVPNWSQVDRPRRVGLLIVPFERRAQLQVPEGALETALEFELGRSRVVQVIPRVRVQDSLRLMKTPVDVPLTLDLAQQVAPRDSGVDVILSGWLAQAAQGGVAPPDGPGRTVRASYRHRARGCHAAGSEFASARIFHAWTLRNIGRPRDHVLGEVRKAEAAADGASERERLFIRASARDIAGDVEEARCCRRGTHRLPNAHSRSATCRGSSIAGG